MCHRPIWTHCNREKYLFCQEKATYKPKTKSAQGVYQVGLMEGIRPSRKAIKGEELKPFSTKNNHKFDLQ